MSDYVVSGSQDTFDTGLLTFTFRDPRMKPEQCKCSVCGRTCGSVSEDGEQSFWTTQCIRAWVTDDAVRRVDHAVRVVRRSDMVIKVMLGAFLALISIGLIAGV